MASVTIESKGESAPGGASHPPSLSPSSSTTGSGPNSNSGGIDGVTSSESKHRQREPLAVGDRCTVYITGLPADTSLRELSNMLYFFPGNAPSIFRRRWRNYRTIPYPTIPYRSLRD
jgi:hypothetical protein